MLNFCQVLRGLHDSLETFIVKFVRCRAGGASAKHGSHGDDIVFFRYILMDYVIGEARKGALAAGEKNFDLVGGRVLLDAFEDVGGLVASKHSVSSNQHLAFSIWPRRRLFHKNDAGPSANC